MGAWAYSFSHPSVFQHHFWTGVLVREWEERQEAGEHPASGKQTGETVLLFFFFFYTVSVETFRTCTELTHAGEKTTNKTSERHPWNRKSHSE